MAKTTGKELVSITKALIKNGAGLSRCAIEAGYYSDGPNDTKIPQASPFMKALLAAEGYDFGTGTRGPGSDSVRIMSGGTVVLSPSRIKAAGLEPGDEMDITFNESDGSFVLKRVKKSDTTSKDDW